MDKYRRSVAVLLVSVMLLGSTLEASAQLKVGFYNLKCPRKLVNVEAIVSAQVLSALIADPTICASLIRLHFHDCFVQGCDASVLLDFPSDPTQSEKNSPPNANSLRGFTQVDTIKAKVEAACPGVVSCADILTLAARDCVRLLRGVSYRVPTGRRDGTTSGGRLGPLTGLPAPFHDIATLESIFSNLGLSTTDLVVLSGLHTVGQARCITFFNRIWDAAGNPIQDPFYTLAFANSLRTQCPFTGDRSVKVNMDSTPRVVDTVYFKGINANTSLFQSDHNLLNDPVTAALVNTLANARRFTGVDTSMIKMGGIGVLTGTAGQIRAVCNAVNTGPTPAPAAPSPAT
eukprot:TRINITY_DN340_c0_g1_i1.p1 TRINITY_DN340_c0_g1~~TRINITY_DN340_c0_g1_i1.p1  ORF type:complete len:399 (-),score=0.19 TRINITY_DN340_c0_g1_i1:265-1299(-)